MSKSHLLTLSLLASLATVPAFAQNAMPTSDPAETAAQRDIDQQQRIEQGLQSGELSTGEAARLEKGEQHIDNAEAKAMKNGTVSPQEAARLQQMQNAESQKIYQDKHNAVMGNPNSASSQRMQGDVQRNVNQEQRIENGMKNGSLTTHEAGRMEKGQAHVDRKEYQAGKNGHVNAAEQRRIQRAENKQSGKVWHAKHNKRHVAGEAPVESAPVSGGAQ